MGAMTPLTRVLSGAFAVLLCATSAQARFLQPDPVGYSVGPNLYAYVNNDPLNRIDPYGTDPFIGATVGFLSGTIYGGIGAAISPNAGLTSTLVGAFSGGVVGFGVGLADPSFGVGTLTVIGGVAGGAGDIAGQVVTNALAGRPLGNINYGSAIGAVIGGAIGGAGGTVLGGLAVRAGVSEFGATVMGGSISSGPGTFLPGIGGPLYDYLSGGSVTAGTITSNPVVTGGSEITDLATSSPAGASAPLAVGPGSAGAIAIGQPMK